MDQRLDKRQVESSTDPGSNSDAVGKLLRSTAETDFILAEQKTQRLILECFGSVMNSIKVAAWCPAILVFAAPLINFQLVLSYWIVWLAGGLTTVGIGLAVQKLPNRSYVKLFADRIEWRLGDNMMAASDYSLRYEGDLSKLLIEDSGEKHVGALPVLVKSDRLKLLAHANSLGRSIQLPKSWLQAFDEVYKYETYQINLLRIISMVLPVAGLIGAAGLFFVPTIFSPFWALAIPLSLICAALLGRFAKNVAGRNRYEFSEEDISKVVSGRTTWSVLLSEVQHIGFAAHGDICRFTLVTHYGRKYSLPSDWSVVLPFAVWRGLKLVKDEEMQAEMEKPISFKRSGF